MPNPERLKTSTFWCSSGVGNAEAVFAALAGFGAPLDDLSAADFEEQGPFFRMGRAPVGIDILTKIPGVDFDAAWERRVDEVVDEKTGLTAHFICAEDLVASKLAAGRLQDLADVAAIREADKKRSIAEFEKNRVGQDEGRSD